VVVPIPMLPIKDDGFEDSTCKLPPGTATKPNVSLAIPPVI